MLGAMVAVMAGNNNVPVESGTSKGDLHLDDWPEPVDMEDSDEVPDGDFGGRRLMGVPENLDEEELSMEFESDKDKNQGANEASESRSDANMSSKDF